MAAYMIFHNRVDDAGKLNNDYLPKALASFAGHDPEVLVVDEGSEIFEGESDMRRTVVLKFESKDAAKAWYNSAEYQAALPLRLESSANLSFIVDGFEG